MIFLRGCIAVNAPGELPQSEHFAVLEFTSSTHYTPGDERSRTNPGHGYPESYDIIKSVNYIAFATEKDLINWIESRSKYSTSTYTVITAKPVKISTKVEVQVIK